MEISDNATQPVGELTSGVTSTEGPSPTQTNASHDIGAATCVEQPDVQMEDDSLPKQKDDPTPSEQPSPSAPSEKPSTSAQSQERQVQEVTYKRQDPELKHKTPEAVGPKAIEDFRESNRYQGLEQLREAKEPLPTMPLKEEATAEEKNTYVHGLVFDNDGTAPVLYRIKSLFGNGAKLESVFFEVPFPDKIDLQLITLDQFAINTKTEKRGLDITKLIVGDLIWVYSLAVTTKFASTKMQAPLSAATAAQLREPTVWRVTRFALVYRELRPTLGFVLNIVNARKYTFRICMQGHRQLVTVNRNRLENPADFLKIKANSLIVAPFRSRQLDYMIFACPPKQQTELMSYVADIPYLQSPPPAPGNIRNNSEEHQKLIESKLEGFDLFQTRPQEVLGFLEPLYSTACGAITAAIADSMDSATHYVIWTSPNLNSYPIQVQFRIPIKKKTVWAVGHTIRGAYEADLLDGQISKIQMGSGLLTVTAKLSTGSGVRFRTYLINSRNRRISVGTTLYTVEERANPVLKMLEGAKLSDLFHTNTTGWISALLARDVEVAGIDAPEQTSISVNVAGTQVHLNEDQEAVLKGEKILVAAVQNSALDVIGSKIAQLQSNQIRPVRYVNDLMANDPSNASPFALQ
ncbi:hypothetical protein ANCCAN_28403, partial [Ancylostoma caninum]